MGLQIVCPDVLILKNVIVIKDLFSPDQLHAATGITGGAS